MTVIRASSAVALLVLAAPVSLGVAAHRATSVDHAFARAARASDAMPADAARAMRQVGSVDATRLVARGTTAGVARGVYLSHTVEGTVCALSATFSGAGPMTGIPMGCSKPDGDLFGGANISSNVHWEGTDKRPTAVEVFGVARQAGWTVVVEFGHQRQRIPVGSDGGFWAAPRGTPRLPTAIRVYDAAGRLRGEEPIPTHL